MKVETEHQFLRRVRKLPPEQAAEAIEQRWQQLYNKDIIYDDNDEVNDAITRMIAYRKKNRYKTSQEWVHATLNKMQHLSAEDKVEAINHHIGAGHQGFFLPLNLQPKNYGTTTKRERTASELASIAAERYNY